MDPKLKRAIAMAKFVAKQPPKKRNPWNPEEDAQSQREPAPREPQQRREPPPPAPPAQDRQQPPARHDEPEQTDNPADEGSEMNAVEALTDIIDQAATFLEQNQITDIAECKITITTSDGVEMEFEPQNVQAPQQPQPPQRPAEF
jgi:hypothetical protein